MIAALMMAAVVRLTPDELNRAIDTSPEVRFYNQLATSRQQYASEVSALGQSAVRENACAEAKAALTLARDLQRNVDYKSLTVMDPELVQKVGGNSYTLSDAELQTFIARIHDLEFQAERDRVDCGA